MVSPFELPPPLALAKIATSFTPESGQLRWEPKWDGFRVCVSASGMWSRTGRSLDRYFPEVARLTEQRLEPGTVLDCELISWDRGAGRTSFSHLTQRLSAGRRVAALAAAHPAQLVTFDLLSANGEDVRAEPLDVRRERLLRVVAQAGPGISVCEQTRDLDQAHEWFSTYTAGGLEGLVIKNGTQPYPTRAGQRLWWKLKARMSEDAVVLAVTGQVSEPEHLVLAWPGESSEFMGTTSRLPRAAARELGKHLTAVGEPTQKWLSGLPGTTSEPSWITPVGRLVVEVLTDVAQDGGVLRHAAKYLRRRPDLT